MGSSDAFMRAFCCAFLALGMGVLFGKTHVSVGTSLMTGLLSVAVAQLITGGGEWVELERVGRDVASRLFKF